MNVLSARIALRERTLLDVIDLSVRFIVDHGAAYGRIALAVLLPAFGASWLVAAYGNWALAWLFAVVGATIAGAPFTALASRLVFEPEVRARDVLKATLRTLPRLLSCGFVKLIAVGFGFMFFMLPGVWAMVFFLFSSEVVVLEQAGTSAALGRLQRLMSGNAGDALMALLVVIALVLGSVFLGDLVGRAVLEQLLQIEAPRPLYETGGSVLALLGFWLGVPLVTTIRLFVYLNLRTRREGWDIQTRFAAIGARARNEVRS